MAKRINKKLKERIAKLQNLAERGVGGEKKTAENKLKKLLEDNNLTEADLNEEAPRYYLFSYKVAYKQKLLCQCIYKVIGAENYQLYKTSRTRNKVGVYCTPAQKIEIELEFEFYSNLFDEELDVFMSAFISKQDLFPSDAPIETIETNDMTPDEIEAWKKKESYENSISKRKRAAALLEDNNNV